MPITAYSVEIIKPEPIRYVGLTYPDEGSSTFLKAVLNSMNLPFTEKTTSEGQHIEWQSDNDIQALEIQNRVSQYYFIKMHCKNMALPSPTESALKDISCNQ
jgi:hypothetical protein